jgi:hypothetical protein
MRYVIFAFMVMFFSCETTVDPDLPDNGSGIVIYSFFRPGSHLKIDVFNTTPILEAETIQRNTTLRINLLENGQFVEEVIANTEGIYASSIIPLETSTYSFETTLGSTKLSSTSFIPQAVDITSAELSETVQYLNTGEYGYPAEISLTDVAGSANFYSLEVLVEDCNDGCSNETLDGELNDLLIEELKVNTSGDVDINVGTRPDEIEGRKNIYFSDDGFDGQSITLEFLIVPSVIDFREEQNIKFVLKSITREYYNYLRTSDFQQELEDGGNVNEPVQVATNIRNGLGTFTGYNYSMYVVKP